MSESPFDRYGIDPGATVAQITERMRELAQDAESDEERSAIRAAWEQLTMHAEARFDAALDAFPETRAPLSPPTTRPHASPQDNPLTLWDLLPPPSLRRALLAPCEREAALLGPPPIELPASSPPTKRRA